MRGDFRIGDWLVHPRLNLLEHNGETARLEPKVMQVLLTLAAQPGEVVTREQVRNAVWPDVFVGEDVLIRAISEIRRAFSDDARSPHTIQTIPKVGYRLIAPVVHEPETPSPDPGISEAAPGHDAPLPTQAQVDKTASGSKSMEAEQLLAAAPARRSQSLLWSAIVLIALAAILGILFTVFHTPSRSATQAGSYTSRPLTTYPGSELQPAFSPDGNSVAFVWRKEGERYGHIYVKPLTSEEPVALTAADDADELNPAWSPDGQWIAFVRKDSEHSSIVLIPSIGGSVHEIYTLPVNSAWEYGGLAWTADGKNLIFPQQNTPEAPSALIEFSIKDRTVRALTSPPPGWDGDWTPSVSPDGKSLAFMRGPDRSARDLYVMRLPNGPLRQLTSDGRLIVGLTWASDGASIIFSSNRGGSLSLWRVAITGGVPEHVPAVGDDAYGPTIARRGNRLIYSHGSATWSILAVNLAGKRPETAADILTSSEQDASPRISSSGDMLAFQSWRSGSQEIWTAKIDGSNPVQLTSAGASAGSPSWSPDERLIAFDARPDSFAHIYVIDANGGAPRAITHGRYNDIVPSWSADGHWLYFGSNRSGSWQIWKIAADGSGTPQQVTTEGGMVAMEDSGGRWLYISRYAEPGLWRCPVAGGQESKIFDGPPAESQDYWTVRDGKVYSLTLKDKQYLIEQVDPETGRTQTVYVMRHDPTPFAGLAVTPSGKRIVFAELTRASSGLTLVEHFQ